MSVKSSVPKRPNNITQLHIKPKKKSPINIGMVILAIVLIYIIFSVVKFIRADKIMIFRGLLQKEASFFCNHTKYALSYKYFSKTLYKRTSLL